MEDKYAVVDTLMGRLTLEQKVGQLFTQAFYGSLLVPDAIRTIKELHCGGLRITQYFRGFRRYARDLLPPAPLAPAAQEALRVRFAASHGDGLLQQLAQAAAELSGYAVIVSLPADDQLHALEIHLSLLHARALLAVVVLENGLVRQVRVDLDPSPDDHVLDGAERQLRQLTLPVAAVPTAQ